MLIVLSCGSSAFFGSKCKCGGLNGGHYMDSGDVRTLHDLRFSKRYQGRFKSSLIWNFINLYIVTLFWRCLLCPSLQ